MLAEALKSTLERSEMGLTIGQTVDKGDREVLPNAKGTPPSPLQESHASCPHGAGFSVAAALGLSS